MAELRVGATARELVPGSPDEIDALAGRMSALGKGLTGAANQLRAIEAGAWVGDAAEAFKSVVGQEPDKYDHAGSAFQTAARVTRSYASVLRDAQGRAGEAIDLFEAAEGRTARWRTEVDRYQQAQRAAENAPDDDPIIARAASMTAPGGDPAAGDRERAYGILSTARNAVRDEADRASRALEDAWQNAPDEPNLFEKALDQGGEFLGGVWDATWGTAEFLWSVSTVRMLIDPEGWHRDMMALAQGLVFGVTHPVEFGKALLDWDTWRENPARALGRLVPDLVLTLATAGGGAAARGVRGAGALRRLAARADDVGMFRRTANVGEFAGLRVPMQLREVRRLADLAGIDLAGVRVSIRHDAALIGRNIFGYTHPNGRRIDLYPDAFQNHQEFVITLAHEREHIQQLRTLGRAEDVHALGRYERAAEAAGQALWERVRSRFPDVMEIVE